MKYERLNTEKFIERAKQKHGNKYEYSSVKYVNSTTKVEIACKKCGHKWIALPHNHLGGSGCKKCQYKNLPQNQSKSHEDFVRAAKEIHGDKYVYLSQYVNKRQKIEIRCSVCNEIFWQKPSSHLEGCGCKKCQYNNLPQNQPKDVEIFEEQCKKLHGNKYEYFGDYNGGRRKIKILCKKHNSYFFQNASAHLLKGQGCPKCDCSRGELLVEQWLQDHGIKFDREKMFPDCKNVYPFRFDFYLHEHNACIEYDGQLHYYPIKHFGGMKRLIETQKNDLIKTDYCVKRGIRLLRIPFFEINNIEKLIKDFLC